MTIYSPALADLRRSDVRVLFFCPKGLRPQLIRVLTRTKVALAYSSRKKEGLCPSLIWAIRDLLTHSRLTGLRLTAPSFCSFSVKPSPSTRSRSNRDKAYALCVLVT